MKNDYVIHLRSFEGGLEIANSQGIVSPAYTILRSKKPCAPLFFDSYFHTDEFINHVLYKAVEGIRDGRQISYEAFKWLSIPYCSLEEQTQIAAFIEKINLRIEKQRTLVEHLKKYKRGVLKAILHQKLRFTRPDGTEFPKWESVTLSEITECLDCRRIPITSNERIKGEYPYYGANGIQDYVADYIFDGEFVLLAEDGGHFNDFATEPIAQYVSGKIWVNNHAHILKAKCNTHFLYYSLVHKDIRNYINNPSRGKLNQEDMQSIVIDLPSMEEQERIIHALLILDQSIKAKVDILNKLIDLKKSLLQKLFI